MPRLLIFLDFEATCERDVKHYPNEIIEFPMIAATILDNYAMAIDETDVFHEYVKPIHNPTLSDFCTELTGIQQETVDASNSLEMVVQNAKRWIYHLFNKYNTTQVTFVTWGDWDLRTCLPNDAKSKNFKLPSLFRSPHVINLRTVFIKSLRYRPAGLNDALNYVRMPFIGHPHSGIDDTRNTMYLADYLNNYGVLLL